MSYGLHQPNALLGREIAGYELTHFIESGAASLVFRGKRVADAAALADETAMFAAPLPAVAAIKLLAPPFGASEEDLGDFQRRFAREADVLKQLIHPHILSIIGSGKDESTGCFYIVLPYMEGGSLASAIARHGPPPLSEVASILTRLAEALDFAHRHDVVHRDVKPGNILLDERGAPYLGDFGIVRILSSDIRMTQRTTIGRAMGSPAYMAPEQFSETSRVGPLSDLYSLGMVVYQMVTGHLAFETTSWPSLIYKQLSETPASPRSARPDLPEPAAAAILVALEKDPTRRFPTAAAFARAFALGLRGQWTDELMEHMGAATMPAMPISAPYAPAMAPILTASSVAQTWPNSLTMSRQTGGAARGHARGAIATTAILLLISCLMGVLYLGSSGSGQSPLSQAASGADSSAKIARTPTNTQRPSPTATKARGANAGSGAPFPSPTATDTPTPSPTATETPTPSPTTSPTATETPTAGPPTPTSPPAPQPSISIGWSEASAHWVWMAFYQFSPGMYVYTCNFGSEENQSHPIVVSADPQFLDNANTCYDNHHGDTVWVTAGSAISNVITVP